jgi:hypothetical protein
MLNQDTLYPTVDQWAQQVAVERRYLQLRPIQWEEYVGMMRLGVPAPAVIWPDLPARAGVVFRGVPRFDFAADLPADRDDDVVSATVLLALDEDRYPVDLIAWMARPYRIGSWLGATPFLGAENLLAPRLGGAGLKVFPSPLEWLKGERDGVVIVEPAEAKWVLVDEQLIVGDVGFGRELREKLRLPAPRIVIEERRA